ncbi:MAG: HTH domain-containing protein [Hymenobacteraceae bacterium]|nr:HTH domain-containing protein [Hymenobacteraceae bacterium]
MNRFDRIAALLIQLRAKRVVRGPALATQFGVSLRTIYRDLRTLEEAGVPLCGEAGVGYSLAEGCRLPPAACRLPPAARGAPCGTRSRYTPFASVASAKGGWASLCGSAALYPAPNVPFKGRSAEMKWR